MAPGAQDDFEVSYLRIENEKMFGQNAKVVFVDDSGVETDISSVVQGVTVRMEVGKPNTALLNVIKITGSTRSEIGDLVARTIKRHLRRDARWGW